MTEHGSVALCESSNLAQTALRRVCSVFGGKEMEIRLALATIFAGEHLLLEDVPGVGKTTLSLALAKTLGLGHQRIQFTSDMLPGEILGGSVFNRDSQTFVFHPGPIFFANILLADEINRASPKTQSALLESMAERQVTIEGVTRPLAAPFIVIASQNPPPQVGTFPLPESQLDRFLISLRLGYPEASAEKAMLAGSSAAERLNELAPAFTTSQLLQLLQDVRSIHASTPLIDYVHRVVTASRSNEAFTTGLSPRAGLGLLQAAKAWALMDGRRFALPDDVQAVYPHVAWHRLLTHDNCRQAAATHSAWVSRIPIE